MKRSAAMLLSLLCVLPVALAVSLLSKSSEQKEIPAAIMVDGVVYYSTGQAMPIEVDESAILGEIDSHTDGIPTKNGQGNFNPKLGNLYARIEDDIGVLIEHEWVRFETENALQAGNDLWNNAAPSLSSLRFDCFDGESGWFGRLYDQEKEKKILASLSAVNAKKVKDWTPDKISFPAYGIEIGTEDGWGILAAWTDGYLIMRDGSVYSFDYDFSSLETTYHWENIRIISNVADMPCGRYLAQNGDVWVAEHLAPVENLTPPDDVSMELVSVTNDAVAISLYNSGQRDWLYGTPFSVQVLLDGEWYDVPKIPTGNWVFTDNGLILAAGETCEEFCNLQMYGTLPPGTYRIVKEGLYAEFQI